MMTAFLLWTMTTLFGTALFGLPALHFLTRGR
jgi:hypothetical protein